MQALALTALLTACRTAAPVGLSVQDDAHVPRPWRNLSKAEQQRFDLGYAVFNTEWAPANTPAGRTDGLGSLFNAQGCDACHNSRRRSRGPRGTGDAPNDLVIQLGRRLPDGRLERGTPEYGRVLNPSAVAGFTPEASISIQYVEQRRTLADGSSVGLRAPRYEISNLSGPPLPPNAVLMPRMAPTIMGVGLLEHVPAAALQSLAKSGGGRRNVAGRISHVGAESAHGIGRFGWQATEPSIASQTASAMAREMGLTSALAPNIDCGASDRACADAPNGGTPEVEASLFDPLIFFQQLHAVPVQFDNGNAPGARLFERIGCAQCHRPTLPVYLPSNGRGTIRPYTDLLLHDLGDDLADRDLQGHPVRSEWRTAPLWGLNASVASTQPLRLLHDGRARSVAEAVLWHGGQATPARDAYAQLSSDERRSLDAWIEQL